MEVRDSQRQKIHLGPTIGDGGEATVFRVAEQPDLLAKIYKVAPRDGYDWKLAWMQANPPDDPTRIHGHTSIAWPLDLLFDNCGQFVGYVMHYIRDAAALLEVFNPRLRSQTLPGFNWRYLHRTARNLAVALGALHACGYVVGDLNESNVMVTPSAMVTLIDTDSFQVRARRRGRYVTYFCPVGKPEYTPPELQGKTLTNTPQYPEHDCFGLGVLIFQLLMGGSHPFRAQWLGQGDPPPIEEKIRQGAFPYMPSPPLPLMPPRNAPSLDSLHPAVVSLIQRCFVEGHTRPRSRPSPEEWEKAISAAEQALVRCKQGHFYSKHLGTCPSCAAGFAPPPTSSPIPSRAATVSGSGSAAGRLPRPTIRPATLGQRWGVVWGILSRRVNRTVAPAARGALSGAIVWATGGAIFGAVGGGVAGVLDQAVIWVLVSALLWASGWWAFGEAMGESITGPSMGRRLGIGGFISGLVIGTGLGWLLGGAGVEQIGEWLLIRTIVNAVRSLGGGGPISGLGRAALVGLISGAAIWSLVWAVVGAIGGALGWRPSGLRTLADALSRVPNKITRVLGAAAGAVEGASAGAAVGVMVGAAVGGLVGTTSVAIQGAPLRVLVGSLLGGILGGIGGAAGGRHVEGIGHKLGKALAGVGVTVGLTAGVIVARGGLALWANGETGVMGLLEQGLIGLVSGALIGILCGALAGAVGGALVRATEI